MHPLQRLLLLSGFVSLHTGKHFGGNPFASSLPLDSLFSCAKPLDAAQTQFFFLCLRCLVADFLVTLGRVGPSSPPLQHQVSPLTSPATFTASDRPRPKSLLRTGFLGRCVRTLAGSTRPEPGEGRALPFALAAGCGETGQPRRLLSIYSMARVARSLPLPDTAQGNGWWGVNTSVGARLEVGALFVLRPRGWPLWLLPAYSMARVAAAFLSRALSPRGDHFLPVRPFRQQIVWGYPP